MTKPSTLAASVCLCVFCLVAPSRGLSQDDSPLVVDSFKKIVKGIDEFFATSPVIFHSEDYSFSPSGKINYLLKFERIQTSFDIEKTNSLISPYAGYVVIRLKASNNQKFGDLEDGGFQQAEDALKVKTFSTCADDPKYDEAEWCIGDTKLVFAYQDNAWVFKGADTPDNIRILDGQTARVLRLNFLSNPEWQRVFAGDK